MDERLSVLIELQELDAGIRAQKAEKDRFPELIKSLERRRAAHREELDKVREALQEAQKNKRDRDRDLEAGSQKVEKLKSRTSEIKTNKEYQALLKEIEAAEQENKAIEDEIIALMEKIDAATAQIAAAEKQAKEEETAIQEEQAQYEAALAKLEEELKAREQKRQEIAVRVDGQLLIQYQRLSDTLAGKAVVEARGESCSGCYMSIPPQVFVNVKKNDSIINCPHCRRILYYKEVVVQKRI
jgi:predicted  nucleic acid-binding Zn-ribbon protein